MTVENIVAVFCRIINLGNENNSMFFFYLRNHPVPKFHRYHLRHIATETVNAFIRPVKQDIQHLRPGAGHRVEMTDPAIHIIHAIIQLDRFVPVVLSRTRTETVISRHFSRELAIIVIPVRFGKRQVQRASRNIIEVIIAVEPFGRIIMLPQIFDIRHAGIRVIFACHMVRHKVNDHLHPGIVRTFHQRFELLHTVRHLFCQVGVYIVVIFYCIRGTGFAFHHVRMVFAYLISGIIGLGSMFYHSGVPDMRRTQFLDLCQGRR